MGWITEPESWIALLTLLGLEVVLGIDNVIFLSILSSKLPVAQQSKARFIGLSLAMLMRIILLLSISWVIRLTAPLFTVLAQEISGRDLILIIGGLFLLGKSTHEMHQRLEGEEGRLSAKVAPTFTSVIVQITLLDAVFSLDSVITAVGLVKEIAIMVIAVLASVGLMMLYAGQVCRFIERHPTLKILALSFLLLIGVTLIAEGFDRNIPKGYIYFSMAFAMFVEMINLKARRPTVLPVKFHEPYVET